jgi:hypothetical protein
MKEKEYNIICAWIVVMLKTTLSRKFNETKPWWMKKKSAKQWISLTWFSCVPIPSITWTLSCTLDAHKFCHQILKIRHIQNYYSRWTKIYILPIFDLDLFQFFLLLVWILSLANFFTIWPTLKDFLFEGGHPLLLGTLMSVFL